MAWAVWLAIPVLVTALAALGTWWSARASRRTRRPDTAEAMQAHRDYLDALSLPARGRQRVGPGGSDADTAGDAAAGA